MSTPLTILAERARTAGDEPWLFHRDALDWEWRSWGRMADQVARGAEALHAGSVTPRRIGFEARQHPDAVSAGLAIQAAGHLAVPVRGGVTGAPSAGCDAWAGVGDRDGTTLPAIELPPAASPLDKVALRPLTVTPGSAGAIEVPGFGRLSPASMSPASLSPADLASAAQRLDRRLPAAAGRPIVCAAPDLDEVVLQQLAAWTLVAGAAWVLEPDAAGFVETVLWARPTVVWATASELERLASRISARKHRRHSRLAAIVAPGTGAAGSGAAGSGAIDPEPWTALEIPVVELDGALSEDSRLCRSAV